MSTSIILADDNRRVRQSLSICLEMLGGWVLVGEAQNGWEALDLCTHLQPDVVIMDLIMPVMDGVTATRLIHEQYPNIKILVLTSTLDQADIQAALDAGATEVLLKYGTMDKIEVALRKTFSVDS